MKHGDDYTKQVIKLLYWRGVICFIFSLLFACEGRVENDLLTPHEIDVQAKDDSGELKTAQTNTLTNDTFNNCESANYTFFLDYSEDKYRYNYNVIVGNSKREVLFSKRIDARPGFSKIISCNDKYVVVGFPCGGPCTANFFIFTDIKREPEVYGYVQFIAEHPQIITYIEDEVFENLIIRNLDNDKEKIVHNPDIISHQYGKMDSTSLMNNKLTLYYQTEENKTRIKKIDLSRILN